MAIGLNRWRSLRAPFERTSWKSTAVEAPTFSLDAFAANAGFAALPWTRATSRCITDWQGNVHEIPASAKPRNGVRVVRNLVNSLLGTGWADNGTATVAASSTTFSSEATARLTTTGSYSGRYQYLTWAAGTPIFVRLRFKYVSGTHTDILIGSENYQGKFSTSTGAYTLHAGTVDDYSTVENDDGSFTVWVKLTLSGANLAVVVYPVDAVVVDCHVDVTRARPGQTEPDEYVSNGVLATPYHDGIGVDGLKYFATDENGARITGTRGYRRRKNWVSAPLTTWTNDGATVSGGVMTSTGGNNRAYKVFTNLPSGPMFGFSCEVRAGTSPTVRFSFINIQDGPTYTFATDAWTPSGSFLQGRELLADGWIRLWVYRTSNTTSWGPGIYLGSNSTMEIRNPQLEIFETGQTAPTAYVPTTTSAVEVVDASFDVNPIVPSIPVGVAQTNRMTNCSTLASWNATGSPTRTSGYDAQVGTYTRITVDISNNTHNNTSGFTVDSRTEPAVLMRAVSATGTLIMSNPWNAVNGRWNIDLSKVSTTRFELITRVHPAVTIAYEFITRTGYDSSGVQFYATSGTYTADVARVAQVQGERVHEIPLEATAVSTINADAPSFTALPTYATNNEGTFVFDFTPKAQTAIQAKYFQMSSGPCYKNTADDRLYQYDGTLSSNYGYQVEGTRTKVATSWKTNVGRYGYRDGVGQFAATAYDGAWEIPGMTLIGPMLLHRMQIYRSLASGTQLRELSNL